MRHVLPLQIAGFLDMTPATTVSQRPDNPETQAEKGRKSKGFGRRDLVIDQKQH